MTGPQQPDYAALLKRSLVAIDQLEARVAAAEQAQSEPIAIIGIGCRFPGDASSPEAFWHLLRQGTDTVTEVPKERWDADRYFDPDPDAAGKSYTKWGAFIKNVDQFDASFFGVSPREASNLDPQQRLLLEVTWESLEHAGIAPASLAGSQTAVYVGITTHDYVMEKIEAVGSTKGDAYQASGSAHSVAVGRLSYTLGLHGPNVAVDTACSSSLVATHWAVHSLRQREADLALAGGVNLTLTPYGSILTSRARMMSFDGHCKTFDASADGYVRGEGCGMLVLKRLSDARRDGDRILALIRGSALNQDGRSSGLTAPNGVAQEAVIRAALANARVEPAQVSYIEAHGTGTPLGDPIEITALNQVYGRRPKGTPLLVGSVKTNIGHLEAAAGVAGLIKTVLALHHREVPPHLHYKNPNPLIPWDQWSVAVPSAVRPWTEEGGAPRRAAVSSFGFSGTNAHVVLEEAPVRTDAEASGPGPHLMVLSAQSPAALVESAGRLAAALGQAGGPNLAEVTATLALGRSHFVERLALVVTDVEDARRKLGAVTGELTPGVARGRASGGTVPEVVFLFTGQGAQYPGMARQLYQAEAVFRAALDECNRLVSAHLPRPLLDVLFEETDARVLDDTAFTQPALFAVEYALAALWRSWGIEPAVVMGHSVGEYVAACIAGVFSLEDGLRLIAERGRLMSRLPRDGTMAAVFAEESRVVKAIAPFRAVVSIAGTNGPRNTVISGRTEAIETILAELATTGVESQHLSVSHAFHSPLMEPMLDEFETFAGSVRFSAPRIGLISNVSGRLAGPEIQTAAYWRRHVREAVRFSESIATLQHDGLRTFLEVGPAPVLVGMAQRGEPAPDSVWLGSLRKGRPDVATLLESLGHLHVRGAVVKWLAVLGDAARRRRAVLPSYPFQRERYWHDLTPDRAVSQLAPTRSGHPLLGGAVPSPLRIFEAEIGVAGQPWLRDHRIFDFTLFPATGFLEMASAAAREVLGSNDCALRDLEIREAMVLPDEGTAKIQVIVTPGPDGTHQVQVFSQVPSDDARPADPGSAEWRLHVSATAVSVAGGSTAAAALQPQEIRQRVARDVDVAGYYEKLAAQGAHYGPSFRCLEEVRHGSREAVGRLRLSADQTTLGSKLAVHPALLDAALQLIGAALDWSDDTAASADDICVPVGLAEYRVYRVGATAVNCYVAIESAPEETDLYVATVSLFDDAGTVVAELRGVQLRRISRSALQRAVGKRTRTDWLFDVDWPAVPVEPVGPNVAAGRWLILGDADGLGAELAERLTASGAEVVRVRGGQAASMAGRDWTMDPADPAQAKLVLEAASQGGPGALRGVVTLWALEAPGAPGFQGVGDGLDPVVGATLALAHGLADIPTRVWCVTRGSQAVAHSVPDLIQGPAWSLAGVLAAEYPGTRGVRIDLERDRRPDDAERLLESLLTTDAEDRVAYRGGVRHVARLTPVFLPAALDPVPMRLEIDERGSLGNLKWRPVERQAPGVGEVEIRVHATGLNFRDVLSALGMYPGDPGPLGNECAGVVTAVGEGVDGLRVGDEVVSMIDRSFATWVVAPAVLTVPKPPAMTFAEAATIPVTFLTAQYALRDLAGIKKGDRVLIHAITGGVGMAALQLALRAGAEVFGTAGTPAKRALARSLGAHHVADSRSLSFATDVLKASGGHGVDIVLNSLAGDFIPESLRLLRPGGHFIEIGKTGIWDLARVAEEFPGVKYHPLYLGELAATDPLFVRRMFEDLLLDFGAGTLKPLPHRIYPIERSEDAFRFMGQGHHTGKIVLTQDRAPTVRPDASYLVTGGLGGLGLVCARWLVGLGARHLLLMGRSAPSADAVRVITTLADAGVAVRVLRADVADSVAVTEALDAIPLGGPPLRGILHAAGVVDDGMLPEQTLARFASVMAPKVQGTWNLHAHPSSASLDFFVMFSSGAALLGSPGQGNYAVANSFMDALAHIRRARGQHALSVNWGSWSDVGMAAEVGEAHRRRWASLGLGMIAPDDGVRMLQDVLFANRGPQSAILPLVRSRLPGNLGPFYSTLLETRTAPAATSASSAGAVEDILPRLLEAPASEREAMLSAFLSGQVVKVLALGASYQVDLRRSLMDMGMDSLMAMELRNRIQTAVKVRVAVADMLKGPSIQQVTRELLVAIEAGGISDDSSRDALVVADTSGRGATARSDDKAWEEGSL